jgi:uncharacterized protein (TIGR00645 family)
MDVSHVLDGAGVSRLKKLRCTQLHIFCADVKIFDVVWIKWGCQASRITQLNESLIMLVVLGLIDVMMISNLLIMVIVGGYETFVSRMY